MSSQKKCARIIATCFKPKRVNEKTLLTGNPLGYYFHSQNFTTTEEIINLIKFNINLEKEINPGCEQDLIIVNSDVGSKAGNEFINSLDGQKIFNGEIKTITRKNIGLCFGAYSDAFELLRDSYEYFIFTEDDLSITESLYAKRSIDIFESSNKIGFLAFVGKTTIARGHWKDVGITSKEMAFTCHGAVGLSSSKVLGEVYDLHGMLPHNKTDNYLDGITFGEVALPQSILKFGYELHDQPKDLYLAVPSYDLMRGIEIIKFPTTKDKIIFKFKSLLYRIFTSFKVTERIYLIVLKAIKGKETS